MFASQKLQNGPPGSDLFFQRPASGRKQSKNEGAPFENKIAFLQCALFLGQEANY